MPSLEATDQAAAIATAASEETNASDLKLSAIISMQEELQLRYRGKWTPLSPDTGRDCLLWMIEEMGEVIAIIKKRGENAIMHDPTVRAAFLEELADMMMFYSNALICYGISAAELSQAFIKKHLKNMGRDFAGEYQQFLADK